MAHDEKRIDIVRRGDDGTWLTTTALAGQTGRLESLDLDLPVDAVFRDPLAE